MEWIVYGEDMTITIGTTIQLQQYADMPTHTVQFRFLSWLLNQSSPSYSPSPDVAQVACNQHMIFPPQHIPEYTTNDFSMCVILVCLSLQLHSSHSADPEYPLVLILHRPSLLPACLRIPRVQHHAARPQPASSSIPLSLLPLVLCHSSRQRISDLNGVIVMHCSVHSPCVFWK